MAKRKPKYTARTADKHELYTKAVQAPDLDAAYLARLFRRMRGRPPELLREDFCGTAELSCAWVRPIVRDRLGIGAPTPYVRHFRAAVGLAPEDGLFSGEYGVANLE